jgi:hypothetical protein
MEHFKRTPFALERYFAEYEFSAPHLLCCSDAEPVSLKQTLALADAECRGLWDTLSLGYTESQGHPLLRKEVAALYPPSLAPEGVLIGAPQELIFLGLSAMLDKGDHVICTWPGSVCRLGHRVFCACFFFFIGARDSTLLRRKCVHPTVPLGDREACTERLDVSTLALAGISLFTRLRLPRGLM